MYKIFMEVFKGRRIYLDNPYGNSLWETMRMAEVYRSKNPAPFLFVEDEETGELFEPSNA